MRTNVATEEVIQEMSSTRCPHFANKTI